MAQVGSISGIAENVLIVSGKKKECSMASARSNCFWASGEHEVLKSTRPSFSGLPARGSVSAHTDATSSRGAIRAARQLTAYFIMTLLRVSCRVTDERSGTRDAHGPTQPGRLTKSKCGSSVTERPPGVKDGRADTCR